MASIAYILWWVFVVVVTLWLYTAFMALSFPAMENKRILLLIAHPDDEAMFFSPTIQSLMSPSLKNRMKILCLSNGNADGQGKTRAAELHASVVHLRLKPEDVILLDDPELQDGPKSWSAQHISRALLSSLAPALSKTPADAPPTAQIDTLITFDEQGVSGHPNHKSCYDGARLFLKDLTRGREGWESPVAVYVLRSVGIYRKYAHVLDASLTLLLSLWRVFRERRKTRSYKSGSKASKESPGTLYFVSGPQNWWKGVSAMVKGHRSQMVWFRWGWIAVGRYMMVNDLRKLKAG